MKCWCHVATLAALVALDANSLRAAPTPTMTVTSTVTVGDYDLNHPGQERRIQYFVQNISPAGDVNNMIEFTLPVGSNQGVYQIDTGEIFSLFTHSINSNNIVFTGNGSYLAPDNGDSITIYSTHLSTTTGTATALARGNVETGNIPFNAVSVLVPAANPVPVLAGFQRLADAAVLALTNTVAGAAYQLQTATNGLSAGWVPATNVVAAGSSLSLTGSVVNPGQQFWRLKGPQ
jgi:hypothetical protein